MDVSAKDLLPIPIGDFVQGVTIPVDLFIRLSEEKFILVGKAGGHTNVNQFKKYQNKEVAYLWVHKKEYYKITHQALSMAGIAISRKDLDVRVKTAVLSHAAGAVFRQLEGGIMDIEAFNNAKQISEAVITMVEAHTTMASLFDNLKKYSDALLGHSIAVSTLSVLIGQELRYEKRLTHEKLALGGLLHDIGLKAIPLEISLKPAASMTPDEHQIYESHAFKGMQMLQSVGIVPDDVVSIVYEHQENSMGSGYPQRIRDVKIHPLAKIVGLADAYVDLIIPNASCPITKNPREALMYIEHTLGIPYNREAFRALKRIVDGEQSERKISAAS